MSFISKVDFVKDPSPYCVDVADGEGSVIEFYTEVKKVYFSNGDLASKGSDDGV